MREKIWMALGMTVALAGCQTTVENAAESPAASTTQTAKSTGDAAAAKPAVVATPEAAAAPVAPSALPQRPVMEQLVSCPRINYQVSPKDPKGEHRMALSMQVELDGRVSQVLLSSSSGIPGLDAAVLRMGEQCRFKPVTGAYAPAPVVQPIHFVVK